MEPISNADRLIALLRLRLSARAKTAKKGAAGRQSNQAAPDRATRLAFPDLSELDQAQVRRACIQTLLAEEFGSDALNEPRFQMVVTRVTDAITADKTARELIDRVVADLRAR